MVLRGWMDGKSITLSLKRGALTVALDEGTVLVFDRAGRLWSLFTTGHHFRRGLNGSILAKWTHKGLRQRRRLRANECDLVVDRACCIARSLVDRLVVRSTQLHNARATPGVINQLQDILSRAAAFGAAEANADVSHYLRVYKPIGILPPDQYLALVLQITEGCSFNSCTFCTFYKDRPFHIKARRELRTHISAVRDYMGDSMLMRRGVFLADANALVIPQRQLVMLLDIVAEELGETDTVYAFLDGFSGRKKRVQDYAALAERGLRRVYVGLESGHDPLLTSVQKPGCAADAVLAVQRMKTGGLDVGVIVMLGLGGERYSEGHVRDTIEALKQMGLGQGDLLYFSEFIPDDTLVSPYDSYGYRQDSWPLARTSMKAQREAILAGLRFGDDRPQVATYDIREFVY